MFESFLGVNPWTALFVLLNTLTIYFVAKKFLFVPVMNIIQERQKEIDGMYEDAAAAKAGAEVLQNQYQQKLSAARSESEKIVKEAVARGQRREEEIISQASQEADAILRKASADIAQEKKKALNDAKDQIAGIAMDIAGKVVERELTASDQSRMIDSFLDNLGDGL